MSKQQQDHPASIEARLVAKAWNDDEFKQALLRNPKATVEKELGKKLPDDVEIHVHEQTATKLHLVLTDKPQEAELSDADLEAVSGGYNFRVASPLQNLIATSVYLGR